MGRPSNIQFENLGRAIKALRAEADLSRKDLAERAGISYSYLAEIENGSKPPSTRTIVEIANALGVEAHDLMERGTRLHEVPDRAEMRMQLQSADPSWLRASSPRRPDDGFRELRIHWSAISEQDREMLLDMARRLAEGQ